MEARPLKIASPDVQRAKPRRIAFTESNLRALKCPAGKPVTWVYDTKVGSLAFSVTDKGAKSFYFYRKHLGRPVRKRLASLKQMTVAQARAKVMALNASYNDGVDAIANQGRIEKTATLGELWAEYLAKHLEVRGSRKTISTEKSLYNSSALSSWANRRVSTITPDACRELHRTIGATNGERGANRALQMVQRLCRWARLPVPFDRRDIDWFPEHERERYLQPGEVARLFAAVEDEPDKRIANIVLLCIHTGARRDNVAGMKWGDINLTDNVWTIPASESKNKRPMLVPLTQGALDVIAKVSKVKGSPYLFPAVKDTGKPIHGKSIWQPWDALRKRAGLADVRMHDLRRTLGSWMAQAGASEFTIAKTLGHADTDATKIYARLNDATVRAAMESASAALLKAGKQKEGTKKKPK